jgi:transglutaminase superfamily protein/transglutaminase TgpA-like protein
VTPSAAIEQRSVKFGTLHRAALTATSVLAALSVVSGSPLTAISAGLLSLSLLLGARRLLDTNHSKRKVVLVHGITLVLLVFAIATFRSSRFDSVLLVVMLGIFNRFHLRGGQRDDFLIAGATAVLITAATTITPGLTFLFVLLAYLPSLLWALWSGMILGGAENSEKDPVKKRAAIRFMAERPVSHGLGYIAGAGVALMTIGFVFVSAFPRFQLTQLFNAGYFMQLPGASDTMELRTGGVAGLDDSTVVLRVEPAPGQRESALIGLYARVFVLDEFDGREFSASQSNALYPLRLAIPPRAEPDDQPEIHQEDGTEAVRVTMNRMIRERPHPIATLGRLGPTQVIKRHLQQTMSGTWTTGPLSTSNLVYKARLDKPERQTPLPRALQAARDETLLGLPDTLDPRVLDLGKRLTEGKTTTKEKVSAILQYFSKDFRYSLDPLPGASADPLVKFLFEAKQGHCELYAGALAVLLRAAGVKTRVATGYYGGKWNSVGGYLAFTQQDAHAWVEALDEREGWMWIDATPEDQRAIRRRSTLEFLRDFYGAAEAFWYDNIIDFDERKRKVLLGRIEDRYAALKASIFDGGDDESEGAPSEARGRSGPWGALASGALAVGAVTGLASLVRRRRALRPASLGRRLRRVLGAFPLENAPLGRLLLRVPNAAAEEAKRAIALYESMRFGPEAEAPRPEVVAGAVRRLERTLARASRKTP